MGLRTALGRYGHTAALTEGRITVPGVELDFVAVDPIIAAFRRMVRGLEFDVCELAPTTYLIAREAGVPIQALPVFLMRKFHHADIQCRSGSGIDRPADLVDRKVGVRSYSVTTGVWVRHMLSRDHGVDPADIEWVVDDEEHVESLTLPPNVVRLPTGESIADRFHEGRIDAAFGGRAGIGRRGAPAAGWNQDAHSDGDTGAYPLFPDAAERDREWFDRTGVYPLHGLVCVKQDVLDAEPGLASALFGAFVAAKDAFLGRLDFLGRLESTHPDAQHYRAMREIVGDDPLPYGIENNIRSIDYLIDAAHTQGLIDKKPDVADLFADVRG